MLIFVLINPRNITIPGIVIKVTSFIIYPNFWDKVLCKIQYKILYNIIQTLLVYFRNRHLYQNLVVPVVHIFSLIIMTYLKILIGIESLDKKQCPARFSPPRVKLSSFIEGTFSPKKGESNLWLLLISVFVNLRNFMI